MPEQLDLDGPTDDILPSTPATPQPAQTAPVKQAAGPLVREVSNTGFIPLDDPSITGGGFDIYKGRANQIDRIAILDFSKLYYSRSHYTKETGFFVCQSKFTRVGNVEVFAERALCCQKLKEGTKRFSALIVQYHTTPDGKMTRPFGYSLKLWRFADDKFVALRGLHQEFPLGTHDLKIACEDDTYQRMTITPYTDCYYKDPKVQERYGAEIAAWTQASIEKLPDTAGANLSLAELAAKLGLASSPRIEPSPGVVESLENLLNG